MTIYFIIILLTFICLAKINGVNENAKLKFIIFLLWGIASFRAVSIGNDTLTYKNLFVYSSHEEFIKIYSGRYEILYLYLNKFISMFTENFTMFLMLINAFIYIVYYKFLKKYSSNKIYSILLFILMGFFGQTLNVIRLQIAICLTIISFMQKENGKFKQSIIWAVLAIGFQRISIVYLVTYLIPKKYEKKIVMLTLLVALGISLSLTAVLGTIGRVVPYYGNYLQQNTYKIGISDVKMASVLQLILQLCIVIWALKINKKNRKNWDTEFVYQMYMCIISVGISIVALSYNILDRCATVFWIYSLLLIPNTLKYVNKKNRVLTGMIILLLYLLYFLVITVLKKEWNNIYPYQVVQLI